MALKTIKQTTDLLFFAEVGCTCAGLLLVAIGVCMAVCGPVAPWDFCCIVGGGLLFAAAIAIPRLLSEVVRHSYAARSSRRRAPGP